MTQENSSEFPPLVDWIGDIPIYHGEREDSERCLCGHEFYMLCPDWPTGGIAGLTIEAT